MKKTIRQSNRFNALSINLASPEEILSWSFGEVTKPETINYRTQRAERDGLFCEKIFGPEYDFQCSCGKYKGSQYQGIECSNCGVEVTRSTVRRERMGHIDLATPIAHYWYLRKVPSHIATLLNLPAQQVQNVIYFSSYYVKSVNEDVRKNLKKEIKKEFDEKIQKATQEETHHMLNDQYKSRIADIESIQEHAIIEEARYDRLSQQFSKLFDAEKGSEVIFNLLKKIDLKQKEKDIIKDLEEANKGQRDKLQRQLLVVRSLLQSGNKPEWMFLTRLPVIPPGIRPVVPLDGGRYASSDLNDLYRHVIVRNNRLKDFIESKAPKIFINTQKRLLQEAIDVLFEKEIASGGRGGMKRGKSRQLKAISEYLSGKTGSFRLNLLGKRVDFTGRSVIVVGSHLKLDEFGLPKKMALEIFRPFVIGEVLNRELAYNVRGAQRLLDSEAPVVWEILEKVIQGKYMLLNRAPTLHRQSIQAFKPVLIEGLSIELHPLVCKAYNADFDGDAMVIHLPLSQEAQAEAKNILVSTNNIINPASGEINASPSEQDMVLGCYWATVEKEGVKGEGKYFGSVSEAITAYDFGSVDIHAKIKVLASQKEKYGENKGKIFETTVGRLLFNTTLPKEYPFVNETIDKKMIKKVVRGILDTLGKESLIKHLDPIKDFGFRFASKSGTTFSWNDLQKPEGRAERIEKGLQRSKEIQQAYEEGLISLQERKRKNIDLWQEIKEDLGQTTKESVPEESSIGDMIRSGARGSFNDLGDMTAMFGVVDSSSGEPIEQPVLSSLKDGISAVEYFNASFGARKGVADTALKTADAGFLSRKLFSVAQEVKIEDLDCKTNNGFTIYRQTASGAGDSFSERIYGRYAIEEVISKDGEVLVKKNNVIDTEIAERIDADESIETVKVRSPITCQHARGICAMCYGLDKTTNELVDIGEPVGTIAAQSVGEPGTQLTMRTFHAGGVATVGGDITAGLPRVTEVFERRAPKAPAAIAHVDGVVEKIEQHKDGGHTIRLNVGSKKATTAEKNYSIPPIRTVNAAVGDKIKKGQFLTDGAANLEEMLKYCGKEITQEYIFTEITKVYELQGVSIAPVHFEIIIRQMFSKMLITEPGDAAYIPGEVIDLGELVDLNECLEAEGLKPAKAENIVTGITNVSVSRSNFLSAASFQNTTSVLIRAAVSGAIDTLDGVKENVIIGRLVPIGSGHEGSTKQVMIKEVQDKIAKEIAEKEEMAS